MLGKIIELHRIFNEYYRKGLIGVSDDYVQVDIDLFKKLLSENDEIHLSRPNGGIELKIIKITGDYSIAIITLL